MIYNIITSHSIEIALTLESMSMGSKCMTRPMPYGTWAKHIKVYMLNVTLSEHG